MNIWIVTVVLGKMVSATPYGHEDMAKCQDLAHEVKQELLIKMADPATGGYKVDGEKFKPDDIDIFCKTSDTRPTD